MMDGIIKADGTSRLMRATLPATYEEFRAQCASGAQPLDVLFNAIGWSQLPTFLNKGNLASDNTLALFGLGADAVPDDVLSYLGQYSQHWWRLTGKVQVNEYGEAAVQNVCYAGASGTMKTFTYGTGFIVDEDLNITLTGTSSFVYTPASISAEKLRVLKGKYFFYNNEGTETAPLLYCLPTSGDAKDQYNYWSMTCQIITPMWKEDGETLVQSNDRNAYPDSGMVDGTVYQYLGIPFQNAVTAPKIATGSYTGTGTGTKNYPNSLTFDFEPKFIMVASKIMDTLEGKANVRQMDVMVLLPTVGGFSSIGFTSASTLFSVGASVTGNTVSWWAKAAEYQMNRSGGTFNYIAIG